MIKGKSTWKYNKLLTARRNYYPGGGVLSGLNIDPMSSTNTGIGTTVDVDPGTAPSISKGGGGGGLSGGQIAGIAGLAAKGVADVTNMISNITGSGIKAKADNMINNVMNQQMGAQTANDSFDSITSDWINNAEIDHITAKDLGSKNFGEAFGSAMASGAAGAGAGASLGPWGAVGGAAGGLITNIIGSIFGNRNAKKQAKRVNESIDYVNQQRLAQLNNRTQNIIDKQMSNLNANYAAFGGDLTTNGSTFDTGYTLIGNGGSHESNPYEGVQIGVDQKGVPNLVEEGEVIFNDYVFSKRLKVPKTIRNKYKLRGTKPLSFADAALKLGKESDERPNDPISIRGLESFMTDLANAQENVKAKERDNLFALGGKVNKFEGNPWTPSKLNTYGYVSDYYGQGDTPTWIQNGAYIDAYKDYINSDNYGVNEFRQHLKDQFDFYDNATEEQKKSKRYKAIKKFIDANKDWYDNRSTIDTWDLNSFLPTAKQLALSRPGFMHPEGVYKAYTDNNNKEIIERHMLRNLNGDHTAMPETDIYYPNTRGGYTWADRFGDRYTRANNGAYEETTDDDGNTVRTYYYDPVKKKTSGNRYYKKNNKGQYELVTGENPYLDIQNAGGYTQVRSIANDQKGTDYYFDPEEADLEYKELPTELRYTPAIGLGISAITDALGFTNKPDYSNADAILEASRNAGTYQPVRFNPIGNYLTYKPFDRDYYINKMNAEAGASRRAIANTSGGNRATAMAGILAADNNYLNQIGELGRKAEEYNLAQRAQVEEFNRGTNTTNSQGFLQADLANQKALMDSRDLTFRGTMAAAEMRDRAKLTSDQAKSANISGALTSLGDIGRENMAWNWRNFGLATGSFGNVGDEEYLLTHTGRKRNSNKGAKGGKIKRKRGLTI